MSADGSMVKFNPALHVSPSPQCLTVHSDSPQRSWGFRDGSDMSAPVDCSNFVSAAPLFRDASVISNSAVIAIGGNGCGGHAAGVLQAGLLTGRNPAVLPFARGGADRICDSLRGKYALWPDYAFEVASTDDSGDGATLGTRRDEYSTIS